MPTSSISHDIILTDPGDIERFVDALEESEKQKNGRAHEGAEPIELMTDQNKIRQLISDIK